MRKNTMHCKVVTKVQAPVHAQTSSKQNMIDIIDRLVDWQYQKAWGAYFPMTDDDDDIID